MIKRMWYFQVNGPARAVCRFVYLNNDMDALTLMAYLRIQNLCGFILSGSREHFEVMMVQERGCNHGAMEGMNG